MFPFEHCIARFGFFLVRNTKTSNKRQEKSKWKPGLKTADLSWNYAKRLTNRENLYEALQPIQPFGGRFKDGDFTFK